MSSNGLFLRHSVRRGHSLIWRHKATMLTKTLVAFGLLFTGIAGQSDFPKYIPDNLKVCYQDAYLNNRVNRGPYTMDNLVALIRKVEAHNTCRTWSIDQMAGVLLRRFRYDGIVDTGTVAPGAATVKKDLVENAKYSLIWSVLPANGSTFPEDALTTGEKCALHWMLSYSVNRTRRAEETVSFPRFKGFPKPPVDDIPPAGVDTDYIDDTHEGDMPEVQENEDKAETDDQDDSTRRENEDRRKRSARVRRDIPLSDAPLEMGVIRTLWGTVSASSLLSGIFTGIKPQILKINDVIDEAERSNWDETVLQRTIDSRWIVTLAGDLGQSALIRGSSAVSSLGPRGTWENQVCSREYSLASKDVSLLTTAEIYGGIDGLLIMNKVATWNEDFAKLSSVLEMYYSERGLTKDRSVRACNRINLVNDFLAQKGNILQEQSISCALVYYIKGMPGAPELNPGDAVSTVRNYVTNTYDALLQYIGNSTLTGQDFTSCSGVPVDSTTIELPATYTDLTVVIDQFAEDPFIQMEKETIALLATKMDIYSRGSRLEVVASDDGRPIVALNYTVNKAQLACAVLNSTIPYSERNFPRVMSSLRRSIFNSRAGEVNRFTSGGNARIVLMIVGPKMNVDENQAAMKSEFALWANDIPDVRLLFVTQGSSDPWRKYVVNPSNDIIQFTSSSDIATKILNRILTLPARLTHPGCKSQNVTGMTSTSEASFTYTTYLEPGTTQYYQIRPEHFFTSPQITLKFTTLYGSSRICLSRAKENPSFTDNCNLLDATNYQTSFVISQPCGPRGLLGQCQPVYVAMKAFEQIDGNPCSDPACRGPDQTRVTFSHTGMLCNGAKKLAVPYALGFVLLLISYVR